MKRILKSILTLALLLLLVKASWFSYFFKGIYATYLQGNTTANIFDGAGFAKGEIIAKYPAPWPVDLDIAYAPSSELEIALSEIETGAFLVFDNDTLRHEVYSNEVTLESKTNSFSMAKSIVTILVQIAIQKGEISGWDELVVNFIPELKGPGRYMLTLADLSGMTADIDWDEDYYNPFGISAKAYYGSDLYKTITSRSIGAEVGMNFEYQSAATALLSFCLEAATETKIYDYASENLWSPLGAVSDAFWHLDESGNAISYCCYNAIARDYGRLGKLILQNGIWEGNRLVDSSFLKGATSSGSDQIYGLSFWLGQVPNSPDTALGVKNRYIAFHGHLGQWIIVLPALNRVIVRTGHQGGESFSDPEKLSPFMLTIQEYGKLSESSIVISTPDIRSSVDTLQSDINEMRSESDALPLNNGNLDR
jgi:CubicO group peptidase (beta-lactamase class C family)